MKGKLNKYVWLIAYINQEFIEKVNDELKKYPEYKKVTVCIPTINVLKKSFKNKQHFDKVPLLFNYGFFKVPREYAIHKGFLDKMQENISCLYAWVKDPAKVISSKPIIREDGQAFWTSRNVPVAVATSKEVAEIVKHSDNYSTHDSDDLDKLGPGDRVILHGYPWEGLEAEVVEIDEKREEMKVKITFFNTKRVVPVAFDNVFFTIYHNNNYDDSVVYASNIETTTENKFNKKQKKEYDGNKD